MDKVEKYIKEGRVAILYSPGYGVGWFTWNECEDIVFDRRIVEKVLDGESNQITEEFMEAIGYSDIYCGGAHQLDVMWITEGSVFEVEEYGGFESIHIIDGRSCLTA